MSNAGSVTVVLSANATSFSAGLTEAQRNLDKFANASKNASHGTVSGMQAASASIRLLENPLGNNIRAIERLISQSKILSGVLKAAFPLVGAIAIGSMIAKLAVDVVDFVKKVQEMPKAIEQGFGALNLAQKTSTDELILSTDKLDNATAKLLRKPQNDLKTAIDEDRVAMDRFAGSIESSNEKLNSLLSKNKIGLLDSLWGTWGTKSTRGVEKQTKQFTAQENNDAYALAESDPGSIEETAANANLKIDQAKQLAAARKGLADAQKASKGTAAPDQSDVIADYQGIITTIRNQQKQQAAQLGNDRAAKDKQTEEDKKTRAEQAKQDAAAALEAQKKAAEAQLQQWESDNSDWKAAQDRSLLDDAAWWKAKLATLTTSSLNYKAVNKKVNEDIIADNRQFADSMTKFTAEYMTDFNKSAGLSSADEHGLTDQSKAAADYVTALRASIDLNRENADAVAEASLAMEVATGRMTKLDAAQVLANLHTQQFNTLNDRLKEQIQTVADDPTLTPLQKQARTAQLNNQVSVAQTQRGIQAQQDNVAANPQSTLASVGFVDALDEFVAASRDAAAEMRQLTDSTLSTLNGEFVKGISGQRTEFGNAGASIFRNVAGTGIQKAEGSILGAFGFGNASKLGTKSNPMYTLAADGVSGAASSVGGFLSRLFGGGSKGPGQAGLSAALGASASGGPIGTLSSDLTSLIPMIPGFAGGGSISAGTLALVGEKGPELLQMGSTSGHITPNHQLSSLGSSGGGDIHFHPGAIDARGATDPAQVEAAATRAVMMAAPHIINASQRATADSKNRTPSTRR